MEKEENEYTKAYKLATNPETREKFWEEISKSLKWSKDPVKILDSSNPPFYRWFSDGEINICENAIDRNAKENPDRTAIIYESPITGNSSTMNYSTLLKFVKKMGFILKHLGVNEGDRVIIYMPMIPESLVAAYGCARIGAIHSIVFGGFAAKELASRIVDAKPKVIISASCGIEPNKIIDYKQILDEAIALANAENNIKVLLVQRKQKICSSWINGRDFDYYSLMEFAGEVDCTYVKGSHPLYILYTSGTTGQPKGIVRDHGGTSVALTWTMKHIMGIGQGDVYFSGSDIGWVVGHSFIIYGPLLMGATTVVFEGKPVGTPNPGVYWELIEKHKVNGLYTAPTALRALRKEDLDGAWIKKSNISSLKAVSLAGERCDIPTYKWIQENLPGVLINDNYWQTEIGWIISCNYNNLYRFPSKPGSATKPCPGFIIDIIDDENKPSPQGKLGKICCKLPMPPSFMLTLWGNDQAFKEKYLDSCPGYYTSGDAGYFDEDGYLHVMTRLDDIINTAGHRLSTAQMEEILIGHKDLVEAAVVSARDELKGEIPVGFVVVKLGLEPNPLTLEKELINLIRHDIGPVASFRKCIIVDKLPKTRSGKILRYVLKAMVDGKDYKIPATIEDISVLEKISTQIKIHGLGEKVDITYEEDVKKIKKN